MGGDAALNELGVAILVFLWVITDSLRTITRIVSRISCDQGESRTAFVLLEKEMRCESCCSRGRERECE